MPWIRDNQYGGFTDGKPWLPVAMEHLHRAVGVQDLDPASTYSFYRSMIAFRKAHPVLAKGTLEVVEARDDLVSFIRSHEGTRMFCAFNLSNVAQTIEAPSGEWRQDMGAPLTANVTDKGITLPAFQAYFSVQEAG
jgi:alpha-glucosidase